MSVTFQQLKNAWNTFKKPQSSSNETKPQNSNFSFKNFFSGQLSSTKKSANRFQSRDQTQANVQTASVQQPTYAHQQPSTKNPANRFQSRAQVQTNGQSFPHDLSPNTVGTWQVYAQKSCYTKIENSNDKPVVYVPPSANQFPKPITKSNHQNLSPIMSGTKLDKNSRYILDLLQNPKNSVDDIITTVNYKDGYHN